MSDTGSGGGGGGQGLEGMLQAGNDTGCLSHSGDPDGHVDNDEQAGSKGAGDPSQSDRDSLQVLAADGELETTSETNETYGTAEEADDEPGAGKAVAADAETEVEAHSEPDAQAAETEAEASSPPQADGNDLLDNAQCGSPETPTSPSIPMRLSPGSPSGRRGRKQRGGGSRSRSAAELDKAMMIAAAEDLSEEMDRALEWADDEDEAVASSIYRWFGEGQAEVARVRQLERNKSRATFGKLEAAFGDAQDVVHALLCGPLARSFRVDVMVSVDSFEDYVEFLEVEDQADVFATDRLSTAEKMARKLAVGVKKFNIKPRDGLAFLQDAGLVGTEPGEVAAFLLATEGLYKSSIGAYLGEPHAFNRQVLDAFASSFSFDDLRLDEAMRAFLATFRLPGEAQKIDRIMETFAAQYHKFQPKLFASPDTAYVLAFALIMLNTDAHNPGVKNKMTLEQFFATTRGIDNGQDIEPDLLEALYHSIKTNEINLKPDGPATPFDSPDFRGELKKRGAGRLKKWNSRFFLLSGSCLYYFGSAAEAEADGPPRGILPLENVSVVDMATKHKTQFALVAAEGATLKMAKLKGSSNLKGEKQLVLRAPNEDIKREWMAALESHIHKNAFYGLMRQKKTELESEVAAEGGTSQAAAAVLERRQNETRSNLARVKNHLKRRQSHSLEEMILSSSSSSRRPMTRAGRTRASSISKTRPSSLTPLSRRGASTSALTVVRSPPHISAAEMALESIGSELPSPSDLQGLSSANMSSPDLTQHTMLYTCEA
ncbi:uncharacterized protein AMSG_07453 [Thecamonas trahens ATCC 50062]|uniref:Cytohesin-2 n=1 Tax=Thecamonas trahens ATCC 50062 TaxID=461836 RepID=A0A0L0DJT4_THETB|nr:hypothetical protein AMSG_07453 [Thecamonas trahens ATCC 50062]KNC51553.1 hypothetical protein AMSG_07453 [Thecamonas trahens ATCC 50062]|eukprot:XP_013755955.1 hypothetical protein AMSG_07453 [Thecamonas trahens ATCC 50062]